ncbi:MAG: hypothetical protein HFH64_06990 [Lachnospiraceae bacterium]|nr:hypothetical protein [Lachnospiraceae bacterium]
MRYLEKEISKGRDLETNIPKFIVSMMNIYHRYSHVKLCMNYFTYYEMVGENEIQDRKLSELTERMNKVIKAVVQESSADILAECIAETEAIRNEIIHIMTGLTACVDIFNIYEYCLNRVEYRYKDSSELLQCSDEELTKNVLQYILKDKDNVVINSKICETVRQLPIRMTKSHFFELVKESLKVYKESETGSVDDFLYMLRTVSMLDIPEDAFVFTDNTLKEIYQEFTGVDFSDIDKEQYNHLSGRLGFATDYIQKEVDCYMLLAENINDLYVILLSSKEYYGSKMPKILSGFENNQDKLLLEKREEENCNILIEKENRLFNGVSYDEVCEEIEDGFLFLEGRQEKYAESFQKSEYLLDTIAESYKEALENLDAVEVCGYFDRIRKLVSGSIFAEFYEAPKRHKTAGMEYISQKEAELEQELTEFFGKNTKSVNRAVMAHILSELPVFFNNVEEIKDYIYHSLTGCRDSAEKAAVTEILTSMASEDL